MNGWPAITTEEVPWHRGDDEQLLISKTQRRKITSTYRAAIPVTLNECTLSLPSDTLERLADTRSRLVRYDERQLSLSFNVPGLLLRSESAASSQIENLTSSARNIALAELSSSAPKNARIIAGNIYSMRCALDIQGELSPESIGAVHRALMERSDADVAGSIRKEQVWVGGTPYSPHRAIFVPPVAERVPRLLSDLCQFAKTESIDPIAKAAIVHAQFETIHPFIDGNGRTGRTLIHFMLRNDGILTHTTVPISAGLLHDIDAYMGALAQYQQGDPVQIIEQMMDSLDLAIVVAQKTSLLVSEVVEEWRSKIVERSGAKIHELPAVLVEQPVVDSAYLAEKLGITQRAASSLINRAWEYEILYPMGNRNRNHFYQATDVIEILDEISNIAGIRRLMSKSR